MDDQATPGFSPTQKSPGDDDENLALQDGLASSFASVCWPVTRRLRVPSIQIQPDIRVFAVLAALQEAGLEANVAEAHPSRAAISREFQGLPAELREKLQKFYQSHMEGKKPEDQAAKYISLALMTEGPPDFKLMLPANQLPPDAFSVREFLELVREFYATAKVEAVWSRHRARYDQAVVEYRPTINQIILLTDGYLRMASGSFLDRQLFIIPEFLAPPNAFNARTYRDSYYLVFGPSGKLATDELRHQYLHFLLDPYALRFTLARDKASGAAEVFGDRSRY